MGIGDLARAALKWLGRMIGFYKSKRTRIHELMTTIAALTGEQKLMEKFFRLLAKAEATTGAHTNLWNMVGQYQRSNDNDGMHIPHAEMLYLADFKKAFDKGPKKLYKKFVEDDDTIPMGDLPTDAEIVNEPDEDPA